MYALVVAFLIPYYLMEKKAMVVRRFRAASLVLFMMLLFPTMTADGEAVFIFRFGATGMFFINDYWTICRFCHEFCCEVFFL